MSQARCRLLKIHWTLPSPPSDTTGLRFFKRGIKGSPQGKDWVFWKSLQEQPPAADTNRHDNNTSLSKADKTCWRRQKRQQQRCHREPKWQYQPLQQPNTLKTQHQWQQCLATERTTDRRMNWTKWATKRCSIDGRKKGSKTVERRVVNGASDKHQTHEGESGPRLIFLHQRKRKVKQYFVQKYSRLRTDSLSNIFLSLSYFFSPPTLSFDCCNSRMLLR